MEEELGGTCLHPHFLFTSPSAGLVVTVGGAVLTIPCSGPRAAAQPHVGAATAP